MSDPTENNETPILSQEQSHESQDVLESQENNSVHETHDDENEKPHEEVGSPAPRKRGGSKPILKVSGIAKVDNNMKSTTFTPVAPINQKNYYTEYLKKDEQIMMLRDQPEEPEPSKTIVIHPGSRYLRVGYATEPYPKTFPSVIAHRRKLPQTKSEDVEMKDQDEEEEDAEFSWADTSEIPHETYMTLLRDLKERMRFYKRRVTSNAHEICANYNAKQHPEHIPAHADVDNDEWTDVDSKPAYVVGDDALKISDNEPYTLSWPIQHGGFNEGGYSSPQELIGDLYLILDYVYKRVFSHAKEVASKEAEGSPESHPPPERGETSVILIVPDLYEKTYINTFIEVLFGLGFGRVGILQEAMGATFGAGVSNACIVDVGAQVTSVTCVDDGMCVGDSRVRLTFGGDDITRAFIRLLKMSRFDAGLDLSKAIDWELAQSLKQKNVTLSDAEIVLQTHELFKRSSAGTTKYQFKTYDEIMLAALGLFYPESFQVDDKLKHKGKLFTPSMDIYDGRPDDPSSIAQKNCTLSPDNENANESVDNHPKPEPSVTKNKILSQVAGVDTATGSAPQTPAGSPEPEEITDPRLAVAIGLEHAIIESIAQAASKSQASAQTYYDSLIIIGGGAKFSGFFSILTDRITMFRGEDVEGEISILPAPREMDPELLTWKGGSVLAKLKVSTEVMISNKEWSALGSRTLQYKTLFFY